jgi:tRNA (cytidine56-2'-O)-methyltransferase
MPWHPYGKIYVLRLGHRPERDKRITTHVGLVARAFGANGFILEGACDDNVLNSIRGVIRRWGGEMNVGCTENGKLYVREWKASGGSVIHLTMYGIPVDFAVEEIASDPRPKLIVVGAEKVEPYYYEESDWNVAVTNQPHSEVAALAVFLDRLFRGWEAYTRYPRARLKVHPARRGKRVVSSDE